MAATAAGGWLLRRTPGKFTVLGNRDAGDSVWRQIKEADQLERWWAPPSFSLKSIPLSGTASRPGSGAGKTSWVTQRWHLCMWFKKKKALSSLKKILFIIRYFLQGDNYDSDYSEKAEGKLRTALTTSHTNREAAKISPGVWPRVCICS